MLNCIDFETGIEAEGFTYGKIAHYPDDGLTAHFARNNETCEVLPVAHTGRERMTQHAFEIHVKKGVTVRNVTSTADMPWKNRELVAKFLAGELAG